MFRSVIIGLFGVLMLAAAGCQKKNIPNTQIEDNEVNREIVEFCERYRHAVEDRNTALLMQLASQRYFDNAGTPGGDDDYDRAGLEKLLSDQFQSVSALRYEIRYRDIFQQNSSIFVEFTYTMSFQYDVDGKSRWHNRTADKRLELERVDGRYLIVSGM